jgi:hypothetical protein
VEGDDSAELGSLNAVYAMVGDGIDRLEAGLIFDSGAELPHRADSLLNREETFLVQIGAFSDRAIAERLAAKLRDYDFDAGTYERQGELYAVAIGPFAEREMADKVTLAVKEATIGISPSVISSDPSGRP